MSREQFSLGEQVSKFGTTLAEKVQTSTKGARESHAWIDRLARTQQRYHKRSVGRQATVVTYAAYFLGFPLLIVFLLILEALLRASPKAGELLRNLLDIPANVNLSNLAGTTSDTSWDAFIGFIGAVGVVFAAAATASSLRAGLESIFGLTSPKRSLLRAPVLDFSAGLWLAAVLLASWVLALVSLARRGVVRDVIGAPLPMWTIAAIKFSAVGLAICLLGWAIATAIRRFRLSSSRQSRIIGALIAGGFVVACNYLFLYFVVSTIFEPDGGGGFGLALVLLLWVSAVVRGVMLIACWIAVGDEAAGAARAAQAPAPPPAAPA